MSESKKKILAISGSTRKNSSNDSILKCIPEMYDNKLEFLIYKDIDKLPHFNPDLEGEGAPASVLNFRSLIEDADGVIICTPEYVFSLPGSLKNALEWTVATLVFTSKPTAIIVASGLGEKALESLKLIMNTLIQKEIPYSSKLLIQGGRSKINSSGKITDEKVLIQIQGVVDSLLKQIEEQN